jgi:hypothetical protein
MERPELTYRNWDDLAFEGKNKDYGAYVLRKRYPRMLLNAFFLVGPFFLISVIALHVSQRGAAIIDPEPIDYTQYYGPELPPPPNPPETKPVTGVRKQAIQKTDVPQIPHTLPDNAVVAPQPDSIQIVDPVHREDQRPQDQYQSTADSPSDAEIDEDDESVSESRQGSSSSDEPESTDDYGAFGSGTGFVLEEIKYYPVLVSDDGANTLQWMVDSRDSVTTHRLNYFSNDLQALFVEKKGYVDKGFGVYFVTVNEFQAVNLIWVRHIKDGRVYLFTGHVIDLQPQYEYDLRKHLMTFLDKYLRHIIAMRKSER